MAALFIGKRGMIKMCRQYNKNALQSFCCFATQGSDVAGDSSATMNVARQEAMGTNADTKPPGVSVSYAADTAKEGIKRTADVVKEQRKNAAATEEEEAATATVASGKDEREENVTVGEIGSVKGKNQSSKLKC